VALARPCRPANQDHRGAARPLAISRVTPLHHLHQEPGAPLVNCLTGLAPPRHTPPAPTARWRNVFDEDLITSRLTSASSRPPHRLSAPSQCLGDSCPGPLRLEPALQNAGRSSFDTWKRARAGMNALSRCDPLKTRSGTGRSKLRCPPAAALQVIAVAGRTRSVFAAP